VGGWM